MWGISIYGRLRGQSGGDPHDTGETDTSEGRDTDRIEAVSGEDRIVFLP